MSRKNKTKNGTWHFCGIPLTFETLIYALFILATIIAICILKDALVLAKDGFWVYCSICFLVLFAFGFLINKDMEMSDKKRQIAELKQENAKLESILRAKEEYESFLKNELEKAYESSRQE